MDDAQLEELLGDLSGTERDERRILLEELVANGSGIEELRQAEREGRLEVLPLEHALREEGRETLEATAERNGVDPEALATTRRALGLPAERGQAIYGESLDNHAKRLRVALEARVPLEALVAINRVIGRATATVASASRDTLLALLAESGVSAAERPLRAAQAAQALAPELERVLGYAFHEQIRELVRREAGANLLAAGAGRDLRRVAIGFADLVGFTRMSAGLAPHEVGELAELLANTATEVLQPNVSLVKTIGDEVMLASEDAEALAVTLLELLRRGQAEGDDLPQLRAGAAIGDALQRAGDWYGQTVNLASRLTSLAEPGALLADAAFAAAATEAAAWDAPGEQAVRGFDRPVAAYSARPSA